MNGGYGGKLFVALCVLAAAPTWAADPVEPVRTLFGGTLIPVPIPDNDSPLVWKNANFNLNLGDSLPGYLRFVGTEAKDGSNFYQYDVAKLMVAAPPIASDQVQPEPQPWIVEWIESHPVMITLVIAVVCGMWAVYVYFKPRRKPGKPSMLLPEPTGDAQIDNVLKQLRSAEGGAEFPPIDVLFGQLHMLFKRAAFDVPVTDRDRTNPDDWKQLLFVASLTELIVRGCRPAVKTRGTANQLRAYDDLRRELISFGRCIANGFGDGFNLASHLNDPGTERGRFLGSLPEPSNTEHGDSAEHHRLKVAEIVDKLF